MVTRSGASGAGASQLSNNGSRAAEYQRVVDAATDCTATVGDNETCAGERMRNGENRRGEGERRRKGKCLSHGAIVQYYVHILYTFRGLYGRFHPYGQ